MKAKSKNTKLFQIPEYQLVELERIVPEVAEVAGSPDAFGYQLDRLHRIREILSGIRWCHVAYLKEHRRGK